MSNFLGAAWDTLYRPLLGEKPCCHLHNVHCEPPSELCCPHCPEGLHDRWNHPEHFRDGSCVLAGRQ